MSSDVTSEAGHAIRVERVAQLASWGVRRVHVLAWRDLDDSDAGGSEVHADEFMRRWAAAGLEVTHRTSAAVGFPAQSVRNGYRVIRRGSRYFVFPRVIAAELVRRMGRYDAVVEVWNGVPWLTPLWCRRPRLTFLHHVHGPMWDQMLPKPLAGVGRRMESRWAPPLYRRELTLTPSEATRDELLELGFNAERVRAIPNGVDLERFTPGGTRAAQPTVIAVGRLAPVKRQDQLVAAAVVAKQRVPDLQLQIVGDGPLLPALNRQIAAAGAGAWIELVGRLTHDELVDRYRHAWLVASASLAEGWGLTLTEAAACGTPSVATDIRGHRSSVVHGGTGDLVAVGQLGDAMADLLLDHDRRRRYGDAALARVRTFTWDRVATDMLQALCDVTATRHA
jgi:glycosyltransferase involved in cell wall biosynthesis